MIELLSPVGDFECLKDAIQNGADETYGHPSQRKEGGKLKCLDQKHIPMTK